MKKINERFDCINCWKSINLADKTCRNHCNLCFVSLHVDDKLPGDRKSDCVWKMYPLQYKIWNWEIKILFKCINCAKFHRNKVAIDDDMSILDDKIREYKLVFERWF